MRPWRPWDDAAPSPSIPLPLVGDALYRAAVVVIGPSLSDEWSVTRRRVARVVAIPADQIGVRREIATADVIVVDNGGYEAVLQRLAGRQQRIAVILPYYTLTDMVLAFELGADDVMARPINPSVLAARVNALARRGSAPAADRTLFQHRALSLDDTAHEVRNDGQPVRLTSTEYRVLRELLRRPGQVVARSDLLLLLDDDAAVVRSVDPHIYRLRRKLGTNFVVEAIPGVGYRLG